MERTKQKSRRDKPNKHMDKETPSSSKTDVKTFKENLKIREILRTVKMNSSMRLKAPRGSKVMLNDFSENEDIFEDTFVDVKQDRPELPSATNTILNTDVEIRITPDVDITVTNKSPSNTNEDESEVDVIKQFDIDTAGIHKSKSLSTGIDECAEYNENVSDLPTNSFTLLEGAGAKYRDRKLSLDHTMLTRRESLSQSEVDLHSIGKSPLERKSSFFKKKMDSFFKNTSEIFKRQSLGSKSVPTASVERRGSTCSRMSMSLQSLNENFGDGEEYDNEPINNYKKDQGSVASLRSMATVESSSSVSVNVSDRPADMSEEESLAGSMQGLVGSLPSSETPGEIPGFNEGALQDSLLNTRAISMNSGLDSATIRRRRNPSKASRFNRVTWLASESLTDYFRNLIQNENSEESQTDSYQDSVSIKYGPRKDSKGRRLSYVRAVSGEDPSTSAQDWSLGSLRRKKMTENEGNPGRLEIETLLTDFSENGIPPLFGYTAWQICPEADVFLDLLDSEEAIDRNFDFVVEEDEEPRQEVLKELVYSECIHIRHLKVIVKIYVAAAHSLQSSGALVDVNTSVLFLNIPDILNANIRFWERAIFPMLQDAKDHNRPFNSSFMMPGFYEFADIFDPYEEYMQNQLGAVTYLRKLITETEFIAYLTWCNHQSDNRGFRLQLGDMLVKPMQRLTKYTLLLERLRLCSDLERQKEVARAEHCVKSYITAVNRSCRQKEEMDILDNMKIEPYEPDFKGDDDMEKSYKNVSALNLHMPMLECAPHMMRCLIHQGDLRYRDNMKEFDARIILFTDMLCVCKKMSKTPKNACHWKLQRPKVMLHRVVPSIKLSKSTNEPTAIIIVILDEHGSAKGVFKLWDVTKECGKKLKVWESKLYEALMSYALTKWYTKYPVKDLSIVEQDYNDEAYRKEQPEICAIEKKARCRVASSLFPNKYLTYPEAVRDIEIPQTNHERERGPLQLHTVCKSGLQHFNAWQARGPNFQRRKMTPNPYNEQYLLSLSGSSHEEGYFPLQRSGSSVEHYIPPLFFDDHHPSPSITVNVVGDNDYQGTSRQPTPPTLVLQQSSPNQSPGPRSASAGAGGSENTLRVASPSHSMVHSLPDISAEFHHVFDTPASIPQTASEKLYRSHQELMQRNRLAASQNYLSPGNRGSSYPPPSPTRPLKRGLAFSYSFRSKTPPLTRSKNVITQNVQAELQKLSEVPRMILGRKSPGSRQQTRSPSPSTSRPELVMPSTSSDKPEKKKSIFQRRSKDSTMSVSPERTREEASDDTDYDGDDDRSRRSSKSNKGDKIMKNKESCIPEDETSEAEQTERLAKAGKSLNKDKDKG